MPPFAINMVQQHRVILARQTANFPQFIPGFALFGAVGAHMVLKISKAELTTAPEPQIFGLSEAPDMVHRRVRNIFPCHADIMKKLLLKLAVFRKRNVFSER